MTWCGLSSSSSTTSISLSLHTNKCTILSTTQYSWTVEKTHIDIRHYETWQPSWYADRLRNSVLKNQNECLRWWSNLKRCNNERIICIFTSRCLCNQKLSNENVRPVQVIYSRFHMYNVHVQISIHSTREEKQHKTKNTMKLMRL